MGLNEELTANVGMSREGGGGRLLSQQRSRRVQGVTKQTT